MLRCDDRLMLAVSCGLKSAVADCIGSIVAIQLHGSDNEKTRHNLRAGYDGFVYVILG